MKNKLNLILATLAMGVFSALSLSAESSEMDPHSDSMSSGNWYVQGFGNVSFLAKNKIKQGSTKKYDAKWEVGGGGGAEVGYYMDDQFRLGAEFAYRTFDCDKITDSTSNKSLGAKDYQLDMVTGFINGYYDHKLNSNMDLYAGLGLGMAWAKHHTIKDITNKDYRKTRFAYQAMAGATYHINDQWALNAGYRYVGSSAVKGDNWNFGRLANHNIDFGVRYSW